jgi:hypothetical protein
MTIRVILRNNLQRRHGIDRHSGTRCAIREAWAGGAERYCRTVTVFGEPDPVAAGGSAELKAARSRSRRPSRHTPETETGCPPPRIRLMPDGPLASLFWRFADAVDYWISQLRWCTLDAICGPERTRFITGRAWQPAGCAQPALCRAAPGAFQSWKEPIGPKKDTGGQIPPRIWLTGLP